MATTPVVLDVRPGNPEAHHDWNDLTQPGLQILTPDPAQSGGAQVEHRGRLRRRRSAARSPATRPEARPTPRSCWQGIFKNVTVMDKSANDSIKNFESGNGDVAIAYENQMLTAKAAGEDDTRSCPPSTVLIQNPTVVVDKNAAQHCVLPIANAFVTYLHTTDAQAIFASVGKFRPIDATEAVKANKDRASPRSRTLFTTDDIGGWDKLINDTVFGPSGVFTQGAQGREGIGIEPADARSRGCVPAPGIAGRGAPRSRPAHGALSRWGLRGTALLYLGLMVDPPPVGGRDQGVRRGTQLAERRLRTDRCPPGADPHDRDGGARRGDQRGLRDADRLRAGRYRFAGRRLVSAIVDIPFAIPTLVTGVMLRRPLRARTRRSERSWRAHGVHVIFAPLGILLALLFVTLPLVVRTVQPVMHELDRAEEEAAARPRRAAG